MNATLPGGTAGATPAPHDADGARPDALWFRLDAGLRILVPTEAMVARWGLPASQLALRTPRDAGLPLAYCQLLESLARAALASGRPAAAEYDEAGRRSRLRVFPELPARPGPVPAATDERPAAPAELAILDEPMGSAPVLALAPVPDLRQLRAALAASHAIIWHQDRDLRYSWVENPAFGEPAEAIVGRDDSELLEPDDERAAIEALKREVLATGVGRRRDVPVRRRGEERWYDLTVEPDRDAEGAVVGINCLAIDVTDLRAAERGLRDSVRRLRQAIQYAPFPIMIHADDGEILEVSRAFCEVTGYAREELPTLAAWTRLAYGDQGERVLELLRSLYQGDQPVAGGEFVIRTRSGERRTLLFGAAPLGRHGGRRLGMSMAVDLTERLRSERALRQSEQLYRAIGESIDYGVWVCAPDGRNLYASESFLRLVGLTQQQCSDFGWGDTLHPDDAARTIEAWKECVRTEGTWDMEHRFRGVDGQWHPVLARGVPVRDDQGRIVYWAGINLDIGRLKRAEEALRVADQRKDEFLALLSHELRNPLAALSSGLALLSSSEPGSPRAERARQVLERQTRHLGRLVDDLLDVSRVTHGKIALDRARVDLAQVVAAACEDARPSFEGLGLTLALALPGRELWVDGDPMRLAQVVGNLLANAAKFTPAPGEVTVTLAATADGTAELRVRDTGEGIEPELLERMFSPFAQSARTRRHPQAGLGIGLSLVKSLVELHGGQVAARSEGVGRGAELQVVLPLASPPPAPAPAAPAAAPTSGLRIVVAEDSPDVGETLCELLEMQGHSVRLVTRGAEAIDLVRAERPDVLICDIGLPDQSGHEVIAALRAGGGVPGLYAIAATGFAQPEDKRRALAAGFDAHVAKPPDLPALRRLLREVEQRRR